MARPRAAAAHAVQRAGAGSRETKRYLFASGSCAGRGRGVRLAAALHVPARGRGRYRPMSAAEGGRRSLGVGTARRHAARRPFTRRERDIVTTDWDPTAWSMSRATHSGQRQRPSLQRPDERPGHRSAQFTGRLKFSRQVQHTGASTRRRSASFGTCVQLTPHVGTCLTRRTTSTFSSPTCLASTHRPSSLRNRSATSSPHLYSRLYTVDPSKSRSDPTWYTCSRSLPQTRSCPS